MKYNFMRFYGYKHWTKEPTPRCFYVGKGLKNRPFTSHNRNHKWKSIVKQFGIFVEVCIGPITNDEVCKWDILNILNEKTFTIEHSHTSLDIGCNFTKGGGGITGWHHKLGSMPSKEGSKNPQFGKFGINNPKFGHHTKSQEITCPCGKKFWVKQSRINCGKGKFCSKQCYIDNHPNKNPIVGQKISIGHKGKKKKFI
jgi:hypothetical protein